MMRRASWRLLVVLAFVTAAAISVPGTTAVFRVTAPVTANSMSARATYGLTQTAGCFSHNGTDGLSGTCAIATPMRRPQTPAVSPDGKNVYVASKKDFTISQFSRDPGTGALTPLTPKCLSNGAVAGCTTVVGLDQLYDIVVSPDGKNVYAAAYWSSAVTAFSRDQTTGALTQLASPNACIVDPGVTKPTGCTVGRALFGANGISISQDGRHVYVSSSDGHSLAAFSRDTTTGVLAQLTGAGSCFYNSGATNPGDCSSASGLGLPFFNRITSDGKNVYVGSNTSDSIAAFSRDTTTGRLTQLLSPNACYYTGTSIANCTPVNGLDRVYNLQVTPDGRGLAATGYNPGPPGNSYTVAAFTRDPSTGVLTQANCVYGGSTVTGCPTSATGVAAPTGLDFSPDGNYLFVAGNSTSSLAMFTRDNTTGVITQMAGTNGCVSLNTAGCAVTGAVKWPLGVAVSLDGRDVYVTGGDDNSSYIAVLNRTH
jgi:6-phosphogluconolactonase (cycloisomerase 2 family)